MSFLEYVKLIARACGVRRLVASMPKMLSWLGLSILEAVLGDIILTREELAGLEQELLISHAPALGRQSVRAWLMAHGNELGRKYTNDRFRHCGIGSRVPVLVPELLHMLD
jgi:hypothetical protein